MTPSITHWLTPSLIHWLSFSLILIAVLGIARELVRIVWRTDSGGAFLPGRVMALSVVVVIGAISVVLT